MEFKELISKSLGELILKNLEEMLEEKYFECEEKIGRNVFGDDLEKNDNLEHELETILEKKMSFKESQEILNIKGELEAIYAKNFFIAGAKAMISEVYNN